MVLLGVEVFSDCDLGRDRGEPKLLGFTTSEKKAFKSPVAYEGCLCTEQCIIRLAKNVCAT